METPKPEVSFYDKWYFPVLMALLFSAVFAGAYLAAKDAGLASSGIMQNGKAGPIFQAYGIYAGPVLWLVSLIGSYLVFFVKFVLWLRRFAMLNPFVYIAVYGGFFWLGYWLANFEPRYTDIGRAIIDLYSKPLMYASAAVAWFSFVWFLYLIVKISSWKR